MAAPEKIEKTLFEKESYHAWNAFVDICAMSEYEDLTEVQRVAHLVFWYESEVQNGGHLQFFENRGVSSVDETVKSLKIMGAEFHAKLIQEALKVYEANVDGPIETAEEFVAMAGEEDFEKLDTTFYTSDEELNDYMEKYLDKHFNDFIELE